MSEHLWQSWSHSETHWYKIPHWDYCPVKQIAPENSKPRKFRLKPPISGWCSWHSYGRHISEDIILKEAPKASQKNLKYLLIDDGWCLWGDWLEPSPEKFPHGIGYLANLIRKQSLKTGLWIAPFLIDPKSNMYHNHPEWIVKDKKGRPINGFNYFPSISFPRFTKYLLDFENPKVQKHIYSTIKEIITKWHVQLLKLDFLYAPYFNPQYTTDETPHRLLVKLFTYLKRTFPKVYILACGCPYKPAKFMVDAIRVSPDINVPAVKNIPFINNLIYKRRLNQLNHNWKACQSLKEYFHLDPDAILYNENLPCYQESNVRFFGNIL